MVRGAAEAVRTEAEVSNRADAREAVELVRGTSEAMRTEAEVSNRADAREAIEVVRGTSEALNRSKGEQQSLCERSNRGGERNSRGRKQKQR